MLIAVLVAVVLVVEIVVMVVIVVVIVVLVICTNVIIRDHCGLFFCVPIFAWFNLFWRLNKIFP